MMSFRDLVLEMRTKRTLYAVLLELTYRCNLDCFFCYNDLELEGRALSLGDYLALLDDLAEMQVMELTLSGGEPLAHPHFWEIGARARDLGFLVKVKSNGHALGGSTVRRLQDEIDPFQVDVSLHGGSAASHDRQTRVRGSFDRLMANLAGMVAVGLRLRVNATLTRWNEHEIEGMFAIADGLDVPISIYTEVSPRDNGDRQPLRIAASRSARARLFRLQAERARDASEPTETSPRPADRLDALESSSGTEAHCGAGTSGLTIDPHGNVLPCVQWRRPVASLHETRITDIWQRSTALQDVRVINAKAGARVSGAGDVAPYLGFCPGLAEANTGSPLAFSDELLENLELRTEAYEVTNESRRGLRVIA
jgi:MoaA/NifB/PqqE/SkfB family radical SAM enzyme